MIDTVMDQPHVIGDTGYIPLRDRSGAVRAWALVDAADSEHVAQFNWHLHTGRPARNVGARHDKEVLAWRVLGIPPGSGIGVTHLDGDPLNCRRANLALNKMCLAQALEDDPAVVVLATERAVARLTGRRLPTKVAA